MRALVARKDADFQTLESVWRPSRQMRIAAAVFTAKRFNKYLFLHMEGMLVHNRPHLQRECGACPPSSALAPHSAVPVPRPGEPWSWRKMAGKGRRFPQLREAPVLSGAFCFSRPIVVGVRISEPRLCLLKPTLLRLRKPDVAVGAAVSLKLTQPSGSRHNSRKAHWFSATWAQRR